MRLARYQSTTFGHPETTGSKSIDYYLISKNCVKKILKNITLKITFNELFANDLS